MTVLESLLLVFHDAEDAAGGVDADVTQIFFWNVVDGSDDLARIFGLSFGDGRNICLVDAPAGDVHLNAQVAVADAVTEGGKVSVFGDIGDGSDALGVVADPGADLIAVVFLRVCRLDFYFLLFPVSFYRENCFLILIFLQIRDELRFGCDSLSVHCEDIIARLQFMFCR